MDVNDKLGRIANWFQGQSMEFRELKYTIPDTEKYNEIVDEIYKLCCEIQEKYSELLM